MQPNHRGPTPRRGLAVHAGTISVMIVLALAGCRSQPEPQPEVSPATVSPTVERRRAATSRVHTDVPRGASFVAGWSIGLRPIRYEVHGDGDEVIAIIATIHGNEPAGTPLVRRLSDHLRQHPELIEGRKLVLVPVANPDGLVAGTRGNARGVDLNRNYPAKNFKASARHGTEALSEPETRVLLDILSTFRPDRVLSIHQPLRCIDYDGPAADLAHSMARYSDLPVKKLGARPGSMGSYVSRDLRTPIVTLELPRAASKLRDSVLWRKYRDLLMAFVLYPTTPEEAERARTAAVGPAAFGDRS